MVLFLPLLKSYDWLLVVLGIVTRIVVKHSPVLSINSGQLAHVHSGRPKLKLAAFLLVMKNAVYDVC